LKINNSSFDHFMVQIITLTSALTNTSKDRVTTMGLSDIVNQFHNKHSFPHSG
ncbi:hypothetical protein Angca_000784, partial [Angiostrongylus cantonensis]